MVSFADRQEEIEYEAKLFHRGNPAIYAYFCKFAFEAINAGYVKYSAYAIAERVRWELDKPDFETQESSLKFNNNFRPYYARWFMEEFKQHRGFFETRELTSGGQTPRSEPE